MYIYKVKLFYWINKFCLKLKTLRFVFFDFLSSKSAQKFLRKKRRNRILDETFARRSL